MFNLALEYQVCFFTVKFPMDISKAILGAGRRLIVDIGRDPYEREKVLENGSKLFLDPSYKPTWHAKIYGKVHASFRGSEVSSGDKLYFHYTCVEMEDAMQRIDDDNYLLVPSDMAFFKVDNAGKMASLNNKVAVLPYIHEPKMLTSLLHSLEQPRKSEIQGLVLCHPDEDMIGKKVFFHSRYAFENLIEGQEVYVMDADAIDGVLETWIDG